MKILLAECCENCNNALPSGEYNATRTHCQKISTGTERLNNAVEAGMVCEEYTPCYFMMEQMKRER